MSDAIYSQGIMHDGPVILCCGQPMTPEAIVAALNNYRTELKALREQKPVAYLHRTTVQPGFEELSFSQSLYPNSDLFVVAPLYAGPAPLPAVTVGEDAK